MESKQDFYVDQTWSLIGLLQRECLHFEAPISIHITRSWWPDSSVEGSLPCTNGIHCQRSARKLVVMFPSLSFSCVLEAVMSRPIHLALFKWLTSYEACIEKKKRTKRSCVGSTSRGCSRIQRELVQGLIGHTISFHS